MQDATNSAHVTLTGTVIECWLQLMLSTGNGTNNPTYDTLSAVRGAGIPADFFDIAEIEELDTDWLSSDAFSHEFVGPVSDGLSWSFQEIFLSYGIVPVIKANGKISIQVVRPPYGDDSTRVLSRSNVVTVLPEYSESLDGLYNQVTIYYDYDATTGIWPSFERQGDSTSQARYGVRDLPIYSKSITDATTAARVAKRILARLGNGAPPIHLEAFMSEQEIELGELVQVTHEAVPDTALGAYSMSGKLAEVTRRGFNPKTRKTTITVALTSYEVGNYRRIGPTTLGNYTAQTATEKARYLSISSGDPGTFSDASAGHVIGPG
jgi:hypothetical protein